MAEPIPTLADAFRAAGRLYDEMAERAKPGSRRRAKFTAYAVAMEVAADTAETWPGTPVEGAPVKDAPRTP